MITDEIRGSASSTIRAFLRGETTLARLTDLLEHVVEAAEQQEDPATDELSYTWGQIEIINATHLDGEALEPQLPRLHDLLDRFMDAIAPRPDA